jgi:hypothetical protein
MKRNISSVSTTQVHTTNKRDGWLEIGGGEATSPLPLLPTVASLLFACLLVSGGLLHAHRSATVYHSRVKLHNWMGPLQHGGVKTESGLAGAHVAPGGWVVFSHGDPVMPQHLASCPPLSLINHKQVPHEVDRRSGHVFPLLLLETKVSLQDELEQLEGVVVYEGRTAAEHDVADHTEAPHVHLRRVRVASKNLRGHIHWSAHGNLFLFQITDATGESEVNQLHTVVVALFNDMQINREPE